MAANEKPETGEDWKARYLRWREWLLLLVLAIIAVVLNILILPDPARKVTRWWAFWSEDSGSVRDLILIMAGIAGVPFVIWREVSTDRAARAAARQAEIAAERHAKQTEADRERRITDSFTKAVELLGKQELEIRLGAIYALERIARESKQDHWPIMETLTAYVRTRSPVPADPVKVSSGSKGVQISDTSAEAPAPAPTGRPPIDIQAVLTVLGRRVVEHEREEQRISLRRAKLSGADLRGCDLHRAILNGADLAFADLSGAKLTGAELIDTKLPAAILNHADLREADLYATKLTGAYLHHADLSGAKLREVDLRGASFCHTVMRDGTENNRDCPPEAEPSPPNPPNPGEETPAP